MKSYAEMEQERLYYAPDDERYTRNRREEMGRYKRNRYSEHATNTAPLEATRRGEDNLSQKWKNSNRWSDSHREYYGDRYTNGPPTRNVHSRENRDTRNWQYRDEMADSHTTPHGNDLFSPESAFRAPRSAKTDYLIGRADDDEQYRGRLTNGTSSRSPRRSFEDSRLHYQPHRDSEEECEEFERFQERARYQPDYSKLNGSRTEDEPRKRQTYTKFVSMIPTWNKFERERSLPDRIELRMCGTAPKGNMQRSLSIPDLCRVKMRPVPDFDRREYVDEFYRSADDIVDYMSAPEFETEYDYKYDHDHQHLHYHSPRHEHLKEMYISQYTHYFDSDPDTPRSHIAGWKVDIEPQGIPHKKSRMCVLRNPLITGRKQRPERPKSAPPAFFNRFYDMDPTDEDVFTVDRVDVQESGPGLFGARPQTPPGRRSSADNISDRFGDMMIDSEPLDYPDEGSSFGYAPSDDTSDTSSAFSPSGRTSGPQRFTMSQPKLIPLSAEFPGIRNLEKMRKKRQSMGSSSTASTGSLSNGIPSPTTGAPAGYGFCIALTSQNQKLNKQPQERNDRGPMRQTRYYTLE